MSDNPYQAPATQEPSERRTVVERRGEQSFNSRWDTFVWTFLCFATGTKIMHVILWRAGLDDRVQSGMLYGGLPLAIVGFFVVERRRRARTAAPTEASPLPEEGPARD